MKNQRYESEMSVGILRLVGPLSQCTQHTCWKVRCWSFRKCPPPLPLCKRCGHDSREITAMKMQIQYFASHPMSVFAAATEAELFLPAFPFDFSHVPFLTGSASSRIVPEELRGERSDLSRPRQSVSSPQFPRAREVSRTGPDSDPFTWELMDDGSEPGPWDLGLWPHWSCSWPSLVNHGLRIR